MKTIKRTAFAVIATLFLLTTASTLCSCKAVLSALAEAYIISPEKIDGKWERFNLEVHENDGWYATTVGSHRISFDSNLNKGESSLFGKFTYTLNGREVKIDPADPYEVVRPCTILLINEKEPWEMAWRYEKNGKQSRPFPETGRRFYRETNAREPRSRKIQRSAGKTQGRPQGADRKAGNPACLHREAVCRSQEAH